MKKKLSTEHRAKPWVLLGHWKYCMGIGSLLYFCYKGIKNVGMVSENDFFLNRARHWVF